MKNAHDSSQGIQRAKVGMIGLAVVVLLIGLASAIMRTATREAPIAVAGASKADVVANITNSASAAADAGEPLAELGVAPAAGKGQAPPSHQTK